MITLMDFSYEEIHIYAHVGHLPSYSHRYFSKWKNWKFSPRQKMKKIPA